METPNWSHNRQGIAVFVSFMVIVVAFYLTLVLYALNL